MAGSDAATPGSTGTLMPAPGLQCYLDVHVPNRLILRKCCVDAVPGAVFYSREEVKAKLHRSRIKGVDLVTWPERHALAVMSSGIR